jgi:hypothetical protein
VAGCCECGDEPSGSGATELVNYLTPHLTVSVALGPVVAKVCSVMNLCGLQQKLATCSRVKVSLQKER